MSEQAQPPAGGMKGAAAPLLRAMGRRDPREAHRAATPLELFFDLCFVVAVAQAGGRLVHAVAEGHTGHGVGGYAMIFFAVWWAWINFSWFASAYDTDDVLYRVTTLVQIAGVLILAAGVPRAFDHADFSVVVVGYVIMRLAMVCQWLRAARGEEGDGRKTCLRYAAGIVLVQLGWVAFAFVPHAEAQIWIFLVLVVAELAVPAYAEHQRSTPWHAHHIAERYGLFTIIVLGETISAATVAVQTAVDEAESLQDVLPIAGGGLLIVFAAYWIYFAVPAHRHLRGSREAFVWGYGHYLVFASAAAIGAGIEVALEQETGAAGIPLPTASAAVTVPTAAFVFFTWLLHARHHKPTAVSQAVLPLTALVVLACTFAGHWAVLLAGCAAALSVAVSLTLEARRLGAPGEPHPQG